MKSYWVIVFLFFWCAPFFTKAQQPVITHIPSSVADSTGIALLIHSPDNARYDTCGAPVAIVVAGGKGANGIILNYPAVLTQFGFVEVFFNFPGGGISNLLSGGIYDLRGPDCVKALCDVIKFCSGEITDDNGKYLSELISVEPNYQDVGLIGGSNGGNISLVTTGKYGEQLSGLKWICNWESPVGDQNQLADMGNVNTGGATITHNAAYNDTTGTFDYSKLKYCDTLYYNYTAFFDTLAGFYFDNDNDGEPGGTTDFPLEPLIYGTGFNTRAYYSQKIIQLGYSMGLIPNPHPFYIPTFQEAKDFWKWRNGGGWIDSIANKKPGFLFMITGKNNDHYINSPDHPGVLFQYNKFLNSGINLVRLNPDKSYLEYVLDSVYPGLPDNNCFASYDHLTIRDVMVPDSVDQKLLYAAGACELADRSIRGDHRWQLDSVYANCKKYIPVYYDSTETDSGSANDSAGIASSTISYFGQSGLSKVFPNPSSNQSSIYLYSDNDDFIKIEITDLSGKIIYSKTEKIFQGKNLIQLKSDNIDTGLYLISISNDKRAEVLKFEVIH